MINMENKYIIYHIPGKKIGVTKDLYNRVTVQQGYEPGEYEVLDSSDDILYISERELELQDRYGYKVDIVPYNKLSVNKKLNNMKINVTEQTTTFPCPVNKLKGQLADNLEMTWSTEFGDVTLDKDLAIWISNNAKTSMFNKDRCYVYNKSMSRYIDKQKNKIPFPDVDGCEFSMFDLIRFWAKDKGIYDKGDPKTQTLKLIEEAGEVCRAVLKNDIDEIQDGIGDMVVVLTNLAELCNLDIEDCIESAYDVISKRKGKMINGTFVKDN